MQFITNFFTGPKPKDLNLFIKIAKVVDEDKDWMLRRSIYEGIASNPNFTQAQLIEIIPDAKNRDQKERMFASFVKGHPQKENLEWVWSLTQQQKEDWIYLSYFVGFLAIGYFLEKDSPLKSKMINYFLDLKGKTFDSPVYGEIPLTEYGFILDYLIENAEDLNQLDRYISLYTEYLKDHYKKESQEWMDSYYLGSNLLWIISRNKNLEDARVIQIYEKLKSLKLPTGREQEEAGILSHLLKSEKISEELFLKLFETRKSIKNRTLLHIVYAAVAQNKNYLAKIWDEVLTQLKKGFDGGRDTIFVSAIANPVLTDEQYNTILEIIEDQTTSEEFLNNVYSSVYRIHARLDYIIKCLIEKKPSDKNNIKRILTFYCNYLFLLGNELKKDERRFIYYFTSPVDIVSKITLDEELFNFILEKNRNSLYRNQMLGSLLANRSLTFEQYEKVTNLLDPIYFKGEKLIPLAKHVQEDPNTPDFVLRNWISCPYVK